MLIKRRKFIQAGSLASASLLMPGFLKAFQHPAPLPPGIKVLVILQLSGGNDGLNTVIPVRNDLYYKARPRLGIGKQEALILNDDTGLHPALPAFRELYDQGDLAVLNSVGYPNPDRSHFRSMDIWQTASDSREYITTGWIGRFLDAQCQACDKPTQAMELDDMLSLAMKGENVKGIAMKDPRRLYNSSRDNFWKEAAAGHTQGTGGKTIDYLYKIMTETVNSADYIFRQSQLHPGSGQYPSTNLGKSMQTIASLIMSDINTRVYYLSHGSFDTHVAQEGQQKRLFTEMNDAVGAFVKDLKNNHRFEDVMIMTFSEFGRRVSQNASGGTDHGTANNMFFAGGALKKSGILNELPDLANLEDGDIKYRVDFKDVYATVLKNWLDADDEKILGKKSSLLSFI